jgi:ubiquinone/menaquinone biosynthesis C-methylase UbiE
MGMVSTLLQQFRQPTGWLGRLTLWSMNRHHAKVTDWGLRHVAIEPHYTILDVGCGGGRTVHKLAGIATAGRVYGIDHSEESVRAARYANARWIALGRVEIRHASVSALPFPDQTFDLVTAVETHFFWPDLAADLREVWRVLKPGGTLVIIAEGHKGGKYDKVVQKLMDLLHAAYLTVDEHRALFARAGYADIQVFAHRGKGWLCGIGTRPSRLPDGSESADETMNATVREPGQQRVAADSPR